MLTGRGLVFVDANRCEVEEVHIDEANLLRVADAFEKAGGFKIS